MSADRPLLALRDVSKRFGHVVAVERAGLSVRAGRVTCLLGDNGAGKSTVVKILAGVLQPTSGSYEIDGEAIELRSPLDARARGIATVYQDLALLPLMSLWRNFFLGSEPTHGWGPFRRIDVRACREITRKELANAGIEIDDPSRPVGTLSGGERQSLAVARALYFGARVLILDEPTAALGVRQTDLLLRNIERAKERGVGIVFVTHNPRQAHPIGDDFVVLRRGEVIANSARSEISIEELATLMAGGPREA